MKKTDALIRITSLLVFIALAAYLMVYIVSPSPPCAPLNAHKSQSRLSDLLPAFAIRFPSALGGIHSHIN